ncbi:outer membrane protein [Bradyrhizobium sp. SYSU BS000235]|uniref:outer membrane protein n=1 Tax=Bradyrhizobium sp. SYSU BS000235 TaxID=3411332 RepID=UPI003C764893
MFASDAEAVGAPIGGGLGSLNLRSNGFIGGAQIGYNWQSGQFLYGLEADIQGADVKSNLSLGVGAPGDVGTTLDYFGTVRGRIGVMPWERSVVYATGGLAYGQTTTSFLLPLGEKTKVGWTVGAGFEYMIAQNWSFKTEYMYVDLGKDDLDLGALAALGAPIPAGVSFTEQTHMHVVRAGVNYHL